MMKRGALDYLVKDFRFQEALPAVVARALRQVEQLKKLSAAEEALNRETVLTQAIFDSSGGLLLVLGADLRLLRFNRACERLSGFALSEVIGRYLWETLTAPEETTHLREVLGRFRQGENACEHEGRWITKAGERRVIAWSHNAIRHPDASLEYVIASGVDVTERKRLEQELLSISELEQRRLGQDLHDGLCQHLAGIEFMSQVLQQKLAPKAKVEAARAEEIARLVREAISQTRDLAHGLSPVTLEAEGLMAALQQLAAQTSHRFDLHCSFVCHATVLVPDNRMATHLYRIAQEATANAIRHGKAKHVRISLESAEGRLQLKVTDDGSGLSANGPKSKGIGLHIMKYRADMMGGMLWIGPGAEVGTLVCCTVPLAAETHRTITLE
jgi:PAS domain S-box-containing protein